MLLISKTILFPPNFDKVITKETIMCDVYKSMYVEWRCNQDLVPPKNSNVLTQWAFVPLWPALIIYIYIWI